MKTKLTALTLAAATAFAFTPKPAVAGNNDGAVIAGAIIGGLLIGAAVAAADDCGPTPVYSTVGYYPPAPVYATGGYWTTTTVNVWVPGVWVVERDHYGRSCRRYVAGHYAPRHNRVWVAHGNRYDHHRGGSHGRDVSHGYGHDRRDDRRNDRHDRGNDRRNDRHDRNDRHGRR
jgi:hypothetical protein